MTLVGRQLFGELGILHHLADLGAHEIRRDLVRLGVQQQVGERAHEAQAAIVPALLEEAPALGLLGLDRRGGIEGEVDARRHLLGALAHRLVVRLDVADIGRIERLVVRRHRVVGGALEHGQVARLPGDDRDRLDRRRAGADHAHRLAGEVDALMRPVAGVIGRALEIFEAGNLGRVGRRQAAHRGDDEARGQRGRLCPSRPSRRAPSRRTGPG